ncbi:hypothetical protein [Sulfolobus spindle-shaped virus]|nr:hypothetical protein [Sulfolobus spindle-shaped virus]AZG03623.1 hypothetical protein [Sulfolobus spindle-shaped virus]AZG03668.1 hypothetical protein [Sulfolobus spindle-shaped virus]AZG03762.1 hypothetical protein [Sulfolobus spindle-shaped virus]AZG03805.1 hypothetical protein [Sulfolobus spindle-shaped virus]
MKVLMKRERLPIVKPFDEVTVEVLQSPKAVEREIALKDGTVKKIEDYSIIVKPVSGKFESVTEKVVTKTEDGDEVVKPKKYDASELGDKAIMKLTSKAYEVLYDAWESKEITEGTKLKIKVSKKQNKTFYDEILVLGEETEDEEREEETEERVEQEKNEAKKVTQAKPKLKG